MNNKVQDVFVEEMQACVEMDDQEEAHSDADWLLCELLCKLGYTKVVEKYKKIDKWYA